MNGTQVPDDVINDTPGDVGGADTDQVKQEAESEGQMEATETEASTEEHEGKEEANMEAAETAEGDLPEEEVTHLLSFNLSF